MAQSRTRALARCLAVLILAAGSGPAFGGDAAPPSAPLGVTAVPASPRQIVLAWVAPANEGAVAGYEVLRDGEQVSFTAGLNASQSGLSPWREYCYTVRAYDAAGRKSEPSTPACARTLDVEPPTTPGDVVARPLSEEEIEVTWSPSRDDGAVAWYEVWREAKGTLAAVEETRTRERFLEPFTQYCYTIRARDGAGNFSAPSQPACARTLKKTRPSAPPHLAARAASETEIDLSWGESTDEIGVVAYEVRRGAEVIAREKETAAAIRGLSPFREYCFDVVASDAAGNRSSPSRACARTPDATPPSVPGDLKATAASASEIVLEWAPSADEGGVAGYEVLRGSAVVAKVPGTFASERGLPVQKEQCYRVRALDAAGNRSPEVGPVCATTAGDPALPAAPRRLRATPTEAGVVLEWDPAPGAATAYSVSRENDHPLGATRETKFTVRALKPGEKHCYRVAAVDGAGRFSARTLPVCSAPGPSAPAQYGQLWRPQ